MTTSNRVYMYPSSFGPILILQLIVLLICLCSNVFASSVNVDNLLHQKQSVTKKLELKDVGKDCAILRVGFGAYDIDYKKYMDMYKSRTVLSIDLVYTAFQIADDFSQPKLNKNRLEELQKYFPEWFSNSGIRWGFVAQNGCKNDEEAKKYFHGFIIKFRPETTAATIKKEIEFTVKIFTDKVLEKETVSVSSRKKYRSVYTGRYYPTISFNGKRKAMYYKKGIWNRKPEKITVCEKVPTQSKGNEIKRTIDKPVVYEYLSRKISDSTIFKVLERNKCWKDIQFIVDVTGSMSPYSAQLLAWHKLNFETKRGKFYTFFNDGDNKMDFIKRIGHTGGIYHSSAESLGGVLDKAKEAMNKGGGGDMAENNIEALIDAIDKCSDAETVVMIADNYAPIKDKSLTEKITKPVHIIVCGSVDGFINSDYLDLANKTGGSVSTMEEDIQFIKKIKDGNIIKVGSQSYKLKDGEFILM